MQVCEIYSAWKRHDIIFSSAIWREGDSGSRILFPACCLSRCQQLQQWPRQLCARWKSCCLSPECFGLIAPHISARQSRCFNLTEWDVTRTVREYSPAHWLWMELLRDQDVGRSCLQRFCLRRGLPAGFSQWRRNQPGCLASSRTQLLTSDWNVS